MSTKPSPTAFISPSTVSRLASASGWALALLALMVLAGWIFKVFTLVGIVPGMATMKPNTALAFLLAGLALLRRNQRDSLFYSLAVLVIGAVTLIEYLSPSNFGIDQLLARDTYSNIDPGRMSQITSVGFTLLGPALALMNAQSETVRRIARSLGLAAGALGAVVLLGHSYDTQVLYQVRPYSGVALHSAIAFVIAAIGIQCANPSEGVVRQICADSAGGAMLRQLLPSALLIPYLLGFIAWIAHKHLNWAMGFVLSLIVAATIFCLVVVMLLNARRLERQDLARREINAALEHRTALLQVQDEALRQSEQQLRVLAGSLLTAQEDERRRLSRELHDDVTQRLAFLSIELGELAGEIPASFEETHATLRTLQEQTLQASAEIRRLSHGLHPSVIEDFGLSTALEEFCGEFEKAQGVDVTFDSLVDDSRLDDACATALYRVTQESLRNAVTHGRATEIRVTLRLHPEFIRLCVKDNGTGFVSDSARSKTGLGVVSMRERIRLLNGTLTVSSQAGQGTEVVASVPLVGVVHEQSTHSTGG